MTSSQPMTPLKITLLNLSPLLKLFDQISTYNQFADALQANDLSPIMQEPLGVLTAARPALLAALHADLQRPVLFITARADRARVLTEQLQLWSPTPEVVKRLPNPDSMPFEKVQWGGETIRDRLAALTMVQQYTNSFEISTPSNRTTKQPPPFIIASAKGLMQPTLPPTEFPLQHLKLGQRININKIVSQWVSWGYQPEAEVEIPGTFSRRGGLLDLFPPSESYPIRIDLFGDEIDSLRSFDPTTQRSQERLTQVIVGPASEALPQYGPRVAEVLQDFDLETLQPTTKIIYEDDLAKLEQASYVRGIEFYVPFFYEPAGSLFSVFDYFPPETIVIIEDPSELALVVDELETEARSLKKNLTDMGDLPEQWPQAYFDWQTLRQFLADRTPLNLSFGKSLALSNSDPTIPPETHFFQGTFINTSAYGGQVKKVVEDVSQRHKQGERVLLISRQVTRLSHLIYEQIGMTIAPIETLGIGKPPPKPNSLSLINGVLMEGWSVAQDGFKLTILSDSEIFGWKKPTTIRTRKPRKGVTPETFFADVNPGDLVVHIEHGIGRYIGLMKLEMDGVEREYLAVEYAKSDKLYVPIHQADRLARYVGVDEHASPDLSRLGSADWNTVKRKTKKAVVDLAKDLLELYAKREVVPGRAFTADSEWQTNLEDSFPFVETDDQLHAIEDVKQDMEKNRPMDRLICGDVGYGKTEVALRAAFKAVMDGTQVAFLAPTTVLAQQHYQTFAKRLEDFPVQVELLSRFRTKKQQEETLLKMASGATDIVIGTHRLVQKDVGFRNLGLLVIDEEQRFGVKHKERLKDMRISADGKVNVDVLTLTATPIPRTLHMSLSGIRDLSIIATPPEERLPIHTTVAEYDDALVRNAVLRELDRGGQVYYVYNRVMGIEQKANRIRNLAPSAEVVVGHGQMSERQLEKVMVQFIAGEADILVSTTIVESGLDIANANTIIIDRADRMGLAQLYQLRGRVGRGARQAYAYLLTPKHHKLNPDAHKRMEAIAEASELGAGFQIAMRDLEIRGAGELLGSRQHGHIAAVGFDLYTRLLAQSINELSGDHPNVAAAKSLEEATAYLSPLDDGIQLNLPIAAYVPEDYLPDEKIRLRLYRRLAGLNTLPTIEDMAKELEDRFGDMPDPVANLLYQLKLKVLAREAKVKAVVVESGQLVIRADSLEWIDRPGLQRRVKSISKMTPRQLWLPLHPDKTIWQEELEKVIRLIGRMVNDPGR